jgi:hypothetical protein
LSGVCLVSNIAMHLPHAFNEIEKEIKFE